MEPSHMWHRGAHTALRKNRMTKNKIALKFGKCRVKTIPFHLLREDKPLGMHFAKFSHASPSTHHCGFTITQTQSFEYSLHSEQLTFAQSELPGTVFVIYTRYVYVARHTHVEKVPREDFGYKFLWLSVNADNSVYLTADNRAIRCVRLPRVRPTQIANGFSWSLVNAACMACMKMLHGRSEAANACVLTALFLASVV